MSIDWSAPIEAYHPDEGVYPARTAFFGEGTWPDSSGQYHVYTGENEVPLFYNENGFEWKNSPWRIRNRTARSDGPSDYEMRVQAAKISPHDLTQAEAIYKFLKGGEA